MDNRPEDSDATTLRRFDSESRQKKERGIDSPPLQTQLPVPCNAVHRRSTSSAAQSLDLAPWTVPAALVQSLCGAPGGCACTCASFPHAGCRRWALAGLLLPRQLTAEKREQALVVRRKELSEKDADLRVDLVARDAILASHLGLARRELK